MLCRIIHEKRLGNAQLRLYSGPFVKKLKNDSHACLGVTSGRYSLTLVNTT
jgi:hypothetical protein